MRVLSLFDGMSCGQIAFGKAGISIEKYYASEIDKYAIKVTQANYPGTIQLGDITNWREWDIRWEEIDIVLAGSPCQGFSFAGKGLNFEDPRSKLFFVFVEILNHIKQFNPKVLFLLENVQMKYEHELVISRYMGVNPIVINSALLSAQNRVRLYWTNINLKSVGLFGDLEPDIPQPKDKSIFLKDVLEKEVTDKYYLSNCAINRLLNVGNDGYKSTLKNGNDKAATVFASQHKLARGMDLVQCVAMRGRENGQELELNNTNKTNSLTSVQKDNLIIQVNQNKESGGKQPYQQNRIYDSNGISPALLAELGSGTHAILHNSRIRRLTEVECERLQTVPDNYTNHVSSTQRYKMLGNGWTVDVITHILSHIKRT
jgi:DNA-cytosine methyltransferase